MGTAAKNAYTFRGFKRRVTSLRVAGVVVRVESSGGRMQIPWQGWYFLRYVENWRQPRMKHRFWGSKFWSSWKNSWENVDFVATVWKLEKNLYEKFNLSFQLVSSWFSGTLVVSPCLWGKLRILSFWKVSEEVFMPFCAAGVGCRDIPTCFKTCQKTLCMTGAILLHRF